MHNESHQAPPIVKVSFTNNAKAIIDRKIQKFVVHYQVKWKGLPVKESKWSTEDTIWQFYNLIKGTQLIARIDIDVRVSKLWEPKIQ